MVTMRNHRSNRRRGAVAVLVALFITAIAGFAALTIDVGMLYNAKADLQRAADAAALAGASSYVSDAGLRQDAGELSSLAGDRTSYWSFHNTTLQESTLLDLADMGLGHHNHDVPADPLSNGGRWNSVQVVLRKTDGSLNGGIQHYFSAVFGHDRGGVTAMARAAMDDRVAGYRIVEDGGFLPFSIHQAIYADMVQNGNDDFSYDGNIMGIGDGIREARLFPWKWSDEDDALQAMGAGGPSGSGSSGNDAAGNFGTLNIGLGSQGSSWVEDQIRNGISAEELEREFGTSELIFHDELGAHHYDASGNPGLMTTLRDSVAERIGQVIGFFIHQYSYDTGSGATFEITGIRFGRIMEVDLTGAPQNRTLTIQPTAYTDGYVIVNESAPSTDGQVGRIVLVR